MNVHLVSCLKLSFISGHSFFLPAVMNTRLRRCSLPELLPLLISYLIISFAFSTQSVKSKSDTSSNEESIQWQLLTKHNISSVRLNPHLLMVTMQPAERGDWKEKPFKDAPKPALQEDNHETPLKNQTQTKTQKLGTINKTEAHTSYDSDGGRPEIIPGSILVATQKLDGMYPFEGSKILIVKVNQTARIQGLILNRRINWDAVAILEEGLDPLKDAPVSYGGFFITLERPLLSLTRQSVRDEHPVVLPGIYFLDQLATANLRQDLKLHKRSVSDYWFFFGYTAWGWDQLFDEIADGKWNIINGTVQQLDWPKTKSRTKWSFGSLFRRG